MKKIIVRTTVILVLIHCLFINKTFASTLCEEKTDNIEYFNATLYNYNAINFNSYARGYAIDIFNNLSNEERIDIDKKHTLFGDAGIRSTWGWKRYGGSDLIYGGWQNGLQRIEKINEKVYYYSTDGAKQGLVQNKLINDNIVLTYKNNNVELFPNRMQAEEKGLVGENKVYKEILRDYKIPFLKEANGYYSFDSNEYHLKKRTNNKFELHKGTVGGLSEWNVRKTGLFPFNKDCYTSSETDKSNELYYSMRLDIPFYMTKDGKALNHETNNLEDIIFDFRGDDDVWIFIDDKLALDIGGGHKAIEGYINFSQNISYTQAVVDQNNIITNNVYKNNLFGANLLSEGTHTLKIFYMERFGDTSNFKARFNLPKPDEIISLSGTKTWKDDNNSQGLRPKSYCLKLYANGQYLKEEQFEEENWEFTGLPKYNYKDGAEISYTVQEDIIELENGDKYIPTISGTKVINTLVGTTKIEVQKVWIDNNNKNKTREKNIDIVVKKIVGGK